MNNLPKSDLPLHSSRGPKGEGRNTHNILEPRNAHKIENVEQARKTIFDLGLSNEETRESTRETGQGDMAEIFQGQSRMINPLHLQKMSPFDAVAIQEDYFNSCFQQHPGGTSTQDALLSQLDCEKDEELENIFCYGAAHNKTLNTFQQELQNNPEENAVFPQNPSILDQSCNFAKPVRSQLKKLKTEVSSGVSKESFSTSSMIHSSTYEDSKSQEEDEVLRSQDDREYERDPEFLRRMTFNIEKKAKFKSALELLEKVEEFEASEKLVKLQEDFNFSPELNIPEDRQKKMETEIRKAVIAAGLKGVLQLFKDLERGYEFQDAVQKKYWFQGVIQRKEWFIKFFHDKKWYKKAEAEKELLDCNHPHDFGFDKSFYDESLGEECLALRNLFALLYGMFKYGIDENGQPRFEPDNQRKLYEVIGNKRFSPFDDVKEMSDKEFCEKAASSTLAVLFENDKKFFETYVTYLYESGSNKHTNPTTLTDAEKRQMLIAGKSYIRKRFYNPEEYIGNQKGNQTRLDP